MMENINTSNSLEDPLEHLLEEIQEHLNQIDNIKPENNKTENPRLQKGITLHQQGHVKQNKDPNTWTVKGQNTKTYNVKYIPEHGWICNCPDHTYRNKTCKHINATKIQTSPNINLKKEEEENTSSSLTGDSNVNKNENNFSYLLLLFSVVTVTYPPSLVMFIVQMSSSLGSALKRLTIAAGTTVIILPAFFLIFVLKRISIHHHIPLIIYKHSRLLTKKLYSLYSITNILPTRNLHS